MIHLEFFNLTKGDNFCKTCCISWNVCIIIFHFISFKSLNILIKTKPKIWYMYMYFEIFIYLQGVTIVRDPGKTLPRGEPANCLTGKSSIIIKLRNIDILYFQRHICRLIACLINCLQKCVPTKCCI